MKSKMNEIVSYMIETGLQENTEDNYIFYTDELASRFGLSSGSISDISEDILAALDRHKEVAESSYEKDCSFYISFYMDYFHLPYQEA